jgi:hypothetical protein
MTENSVTKQKLCSFIEQAESLVELVGCLRG